jgi:hypothetical protein
VTCAFSHWLSWGVLRWGEDGGVGGRSTVGKWLDSRAVSADLAEASL